ncbi:MAG: hypothetical protein SFY67_10170 [Candidatus Melainabacteria bacterium]|nr:hypothetical protein [Candidatus Melainabacteria bacterium]
MNKNAIQICLSILIAVMQPAIAGDANVDKSKVTTDSASLLFDAQVLDHFQQGDSNKPSRAWLAFQVLLKSGVAARSKIDQLLGSKSGGARLYGAILLQQIDSAKATKLLKSWLNDKTRVVFSQGCAKEETTVGDLSKRLLKGEQLVMLKEPN